MQAFTLSLLEHLPLTLGEENLKRENHLLVLSEAIFFSVHVQVCVEGREGKTHIDVKYRPPLVALVLAFVA